MTEKEHIAKAFELISSVAVRGADVDALAVARSELRKAYDMLKTKESEVKKNGR